MEMPWKRFIFTYLLLVKIWLVSASHKTVRTQVYRRSDVFDMMVEGFILTPIRDFYARNYIFIFIKLQCVGNMHFT